MKTTIFALTLPVSSGAAAIHAFADSGDGPGSGTSANFPASGPLGTSISLRGQVATMTVAYEQLYVGLASPSC
jgi:hypothetical protein